MDANRVLKLGDLTLREGKIGFVPATNLRFLVSTTQLVAIGFHYDYEEGSSFKETTQLRLNVQLGSNQPLRADIKIADTPMLPDSQRGFLSVLLRPAAPGEQQCRFVVEAEYDASTWGGKSAGKKQILRREGTFSLRVT